MKKLAIKITALLMSATCFLLLFACNKNDDNGKDTSKKSGEKSVIRDIRLPFSQEDSLNPYMAKSQINLNLFPLIYSSLYYIDNSYEPQPQVAQSSTVLGLEISVQLSSGKRFADGSYITAQDVVHSFNLAKQSPYYSQSVINITKAQAKGSQQVAFTLATPDAYALACLNFPIVKDTTTIDNALQIPVSSGKYAVKTDASGKYLEVNKYFDGFSSKSTKIELTNITDSNAIIYSLVIGNIDSLFCNLSEGVYERINAGTRDVVMNNFVYLGINSYSTRLADPALRQAISTVIDREAIINEGFQGFAQEAYTPFNPKWFALGSIKQPGKDANKEDALKYISNKKNLTLTLIVNADNEFKKLAGQKIAQELREMGIKVNLSELNFSAYNSAVVSGRYDLYLGEMRFTNNMNIYPILPTTSASYVFYTQLLGGAITMQNFLDNFYTELPFIPICYRKGVLAFSRHISVEVISHENDVYANIGEWQLNN